MDNHQTLGRNIVARALLFLLLLSPVLKLSLLADYLIRYSYYAQVLCENRDKPQLGCNGKCRLVKGLQAVEKPANMPELPPYLLWKEEPPALPFQIFGIKNQTQESFIKCYPLFVCRPENPPLLNILKPPPEERV